MGQDEAMKDRQDFADFLTELDHAVQNLYDPAVLRKSRLGEMVGLDVQASPARLRQILLDEIEALKPKSAIGAESKAWRTYRVLLHRYVEQFPRSDVARTLGLSIRQLTREDSRALRVLSDHLWSRYVDAAGRDRATGGTDTDTAALNSGPSQEQELEWLRSSLPNEAIDVQETIEAVVRTVSPLMQALGVRAELRALPVPAVAGQGSTLRQALLDVMTACIHAVPHGSLTIDTEAAAQQVRIVVQANAVETLECPLDEQQAEGLDMARRLLTLMGGVLAVSPSGGQNCAVTLSLALAEQVAVLIVDDNADTVQLFRRFVAGTRYPFHSCSEPGQALQVARDVRPQIIVLDVMLPGVDGWQLLQQLREHPATRHIPVILCSILPEERLALTLGAAAYLRKPVSRKDFLAALDHQAALLEQGSSSRHQ
jgi:CheY-like chemotaxis protein